MPCIIPCTHIVAVSISTTCRAVLTLRGTEVFAGSRGSRAGAPRLLDAEGPALVDLALKGVLRSVRILGSDHLDEAEATALTGVWVTHNVALLDSAVLLEENGDLFLGQARVDAGDEEVGALVDVAWLTAAGCLALTTVALAAVGAPAWAATDREIMDPTPSTGDCVQGTVGSGVGGTERPAAGLMVLVNVIRSFSLVLSLPFYPSPHHPLQFAILFTQAKKTTVSFAFLSLFLST